MAVLRFQIKLLRHDFTELVCMDIFHVRVVKRTFCIFIHYSTFEDKYLLHFTCPDIISAHRIELFHRNKTVFVLID